MTSYTLTNLQPSPYDPRDFAFAPKERELPSRIDLLPEVEEVEDQEQQGSCTANATTSAVEILDNRGGYKEDLSRQFNYFVTRRDEDRLGKEGAVLRDAVHAGLKYGFPLETEWPYDAAKMDVEPPQPVFTSASSRKITRYESVQTYSWPVPFVSNDDVIKSIKLALAEGLPVVIAIPVYAPFFALKGPLKDQNYHISDPVKGGYYEYAGNHAVTIIGYDDEYGGFIFQNSWGKNWGDGGFGLYPYRIVWTIYEAWVVRGYRDIDIIAPQPDSEPLPDPLPEPEPIPEPVPVDPVPVPDPVPPTPEPVPEPVPVVEPEEKSSGDKIGIIAIFAVILIIGSKMLGLW